MESHPPAPSHLPDSPPELGISPQEEGYLKALEICYYVYGGLHALGLAFLIFHGLFMSTMFFTVPSADASGEAAPVMLIMGLFYVVMGLFVVAGAVLSYLAGRGIAKRERKTLIYIVAGISCMSFPFGTALGVCTFILLSKPGVAGRFAQSRTQ